MRNRNIEAEKANNRLDNLAEMVRDSKITVLDALNEAFAHGVKFGTDDAKETVK
jgi:hypothetical protein